MEALCYADKSVTERTDDLSEVLIGDSSALSHSGYRMIRRRPGVTVVMLRNRL